jgi:hypothetical protein
MTGIPELPTSSTTGGRGQRLRRSDPRTHLDGDRPTAQPRSPRATSSRPARDQMSRSDRRRRAGMWVCVPSGSTGVAWRCRGPAPAPTVRCPRGVKGNTAPALDPKPPRSTRPPRRSRSWTWRRWGGSERHGGGATRVLPERARWKSGALEGIDPSATWVERPWSGLDGLDGSAEPALRPSSVSAEQGRRHRRGGSCRSPSAGPLLADVPYPSASSPQRVPSVWALTTTFRAGTDREK